MVSINYSAREVCCKIVYYGPGLSGKTTNLQYVHSKVPGNTRGDLISLATEADRTLYFDFLPINIGTINGFTAKFQLYTVPGQVYYNATRKLVLRGVDGIVFVADSQPEKMDENIESITNLEENLREYGYDIATIPLILQFNKRDLPGVLPVEELNTKLNKYNWPTYEASATVGNGVFDTLKKIIKMVLDKAKSSSAPKIKQAPVAAVPPPVETAPSVAADVPAATAPSEKAPELVRRPVGETSPEGPSVSFEKGETASTGKVAVTEAAYRPYPGSEREAPREKKISSAALKSSQEDELAAASLEKNVIDRQDDTTEEPPARMHTPQMAPSLRRRGDGKKRGFFKRLFGKK
ncbi:MAG: GTPase domain-containing protein [candidate division Zixibacteria bacterium]|nr:GTPase domain-containing protein [candidate division Zixibacteria bacterium]